MNECEVRLARRYGLSETDVSLLLGLLGVVLVMLVH